MKLLFDFDGVLNKISQRYRGLAQGIKEGDYLLAIFQSEAWRDYTLSMEANDGIEVLREIIKNHEVSLVSRRLECDRDILVTWLKNNRINIPTERIHLRTHFLEYTEFEFKNLVAQPMDDFWDDDPGIVDGIFNAHLFINWEDVEEYLRRLK